MFHHNLSEPKFFLESPTRLFSHSISRDWTTTFTFVFLVDPPRVSSGTFSTLVRLLPSTLTSFHRSESYTTLRLQSYCPERLILHPRPHRPPSLFFSLQSPTEVPKTELVNTSSVPYHWPSCEVILSHLTPPSLNRIILVCKIKPESYQFIEQGSSVSIMCCLDPKFRCGQSKISSKILLYATLRWCVLSKRDFFRLTGRTATVKWLDKLHREGVEVVSVQQHPEPHQQQQLVSVGLRDYPV